MNGPWVLQLSYCFRCHCALLNYQLGMTNCSLRWLLARGSMPANMTYLQAVLARILIRGTNVPPSATATYTHNDDTCTFAKLYQPHECSHSGCVWGGGSNKAFALPLENFVLQKWLYDRRAFSVAIHTARQPPPPPSSVNVVVYTHCTAAPNQTPLKRECGGQVCCVLSTSVQVFPSVENVRNSLEGYMG